MTICESGSSPKLFAQEKHQGPAKDATNREKRPGIEYPAWQKKRKILQNCLQRERLGEGRQTEKRMSEPLSIGGESFKKKKKKKKKEWAKKGDGPEGPGR